MTTRDPSNSISTPLPVMGDEIAPQRSRELSGRYLVVGVLLLGSSALLAETAQDTKLMQIIFVGLAALTVPHMVLVEQIRFYGWPKEKTHG